MLVERACDRVWEPERRVKVGMQAGKGTLEMREECRKDRRDGVEKA